MKKILWVCNTPLPDMQSIIGSKSYQEGWLVGISNQLRARNDIDFYYAFPQRKFKKIFRKTINRIHFLGVNDFRENAFDIKQENIELVRNLVKEINPDIIHIFGTEFPHSLEWAYGIEQKAKIIVSIQGLTSEISKVYLCGIPFWFQLMGSFRKGKYNCLRKEQIDFYKRGMNEQKLLKTVRNVIGRTNWDRMCVKTINPRCRYEHCGEILRNSFYEDTWDISKIRRCSIVVSQAHYPIKGLHILIAALPMIKKKYPDVMVYVAGVDVFSDKRTPYGKYVCNLIKRFHVSNNIVFLGSLSEKKMKELLLKSHIMLMPSLIENSPNSIGEAALLGVPVVAAAVGGIPDLVNNEVEGFLYPAVDKYALAQKVCRLFRNDHLALYFSHNAKKRALELYDRKRNSEQLMQIYDRRCEEIYRRGCGEK